MTDYTVIRSHRRTMALEVTREGAALVRAPYAASDAAIAASRRSTRRGWKATWPAVRRIWRPTPSHRPSRWRHGGQQAKAVLPQRVAYWARRMDVQPAGITITAARTRFGSCSGKNRLSFSLYLMAYPAAAIEYVVVHELAHIRHHDHSPAFYAEVERYLPDWRVRRELLKN